MPRINLLPDELVEPESPVERTPAPPPQAAASAQCPGCLGKGRYVGLLSVEDPCRFCNGSGVASASANAKGRGSGLESAPPQFGDDELPF